MGADGGSIARRSEVVQKNTGRSIDNNALDIESIWTHCALSHQKLEDPVVSDYNGSLYNKAAILELLTGNYSGPKPKNKRITQIRDFVELNRDFDEEGNQWIEPITQKKLETEGSSEKFAYLAECGHVLSASVLTDKESSCPICETKYEDIVILNPQTVESKQKNQMRIDRLTSLGLAHSLRPLKKSHKRRHPARNEVGENGEDDDATKNRKTIA